MYPLLWLFYLCLSGLVHRGELCRPQVRAVRQPGVPQRAGLSSLRLRRGHRAVGIGASERESTAALSGVGGSDLLLEWLTGFVLERLFHQRWWDYSQEPFNLNGYICLRFSIAWGLACLFVVKLVHPSVLWCIRTIPHPVGVGLLILFL